MSTYLPKELADALHRAESGELELIDPATNRVYLVVESETHRRAIADARRFHDREAIADGLREMEAGGGKPLADVEQEMRDEFGYQPRT